VVLSFSVLLSLVTVREQEAQLSQRDHAMLHVIEYFAKLFKIIRNDTLEYGVCKSIFAARCYA